MRPGFRIRERLRLRASPIHGKGVFAREFIPAGTRLIEYRGEKISPEEAETRYLWYPDVPYHTFLFTVDDDLVLDAGNHGNLARWINHSCDPNCRSVIEDRRVYIESIRDIQPDEELTYDYQLTTAEPHTAAVKRRFPCVCGAPGCRGTMLARKR